LRDRIEEVCGLLTAESVLIEFLFVDRSLMASAKKKFLFLVVVNLLSCSQTKEHLLTPVVTPSSNPLLPSYSSMRTPGHCFVISF
jgi:hypothetical protein